MKLPWKDAPDGRGAFLSWCKNGDIWLQQNPLGSWFYTYRPVGATPRHVHAGSLGQAKTETVADIRRLLRGGA
jgi:hypothetical protein